MEDFAKVDERENCFALDFTKVDTDNFDYEVGTYFAKWRSYDTNQKLFVPYITKPDVGAW